MKSKITRKLKKPQSSEPKSRDKVRKIYSATRATKKIGKSTTPLADRRSGTRADRHKSKGILKQIQLELNG